MVPNCTSMSTPRSILIGLLICGNMIGSVVDAHGNYQEIYTNYLRSTIPHNCVAKIDIKSFKIGNLEFPDERRLDDYDIFVITGSGIILPIYFQGIGRSQLSISSKLSVRRRYSMDQKAPSFPEGPS